MWFYAAVAAADLSVGLNQMESDSDGDLTRQVPGHCERIGGAADVTQKQILFYAHHFFGSRCSISRS